MNEVASGTETAVISTPATLDNEATDGVYVLVVDLNELDVGDSVTITITTKALSAGTMRQAYAETFSGVQADEIMHSLPIPSMHEVEFTLEQTAGVGRDFDWSVRALS